MQNDRSRIEASAKRQPTDTSGGTTPSWNLIASQVVPQMNDGMRKRTRSDAMKTAVLNQSAPQRQRGQRPRRHAAYRTRSRNDLGNPRRQRSASGAPTFAPRSM